jgi:Zn finger protein HypA/HybF involved in hydrogenase expression
MYRETDDERGKVWMHKCRHRAIFVGTDRVHCPFCGKTKAEIKPDQEEETDEERSR